MTEPHHAGDDKQATIHSASPARGDFDRIQHCQHVHNSCGSNEARAVISRGARNVRPGGFEEARKIIEDARAGVRQKTERAEWVAGMRRKYVATKQITANHQSADREEKEQRPAPAPQQQMSEARHQPRRDCREQRQHGATGTCCNGKLYVGEPISGTGIQAGTTIAAINASAATITLSKSATSTTTGDTVTMS